MRGKKSLHRVSRDVSEPNLTVLGGMNMLRIGKRIFSIVALAAAVCNAGMASEAFAQASEGNKDPQALLEQEEALLRQLTGGAGSPSGSSEILKLRPRSDFAVASADGQKFTIPGKVSAPNVETISEVQDFAPVKNQKVEDLIDQQARAALAKIADVKEKAASDAKRSGAEPAGFELVGADPITASGAQRAENPITTTSFVESVPHGETALAKVTSLSKELGTRDSEVSNLKEQLSSAQRKAISAEGRAAALAKQVEGLRAKLMVAETEVERLSRTIETRNQQVIQQANAATTFSRTALPPIGSASMGGAARTSQPATVVRERVIIKEGKAAEDLPVVVVTSDKANLRTGPGQDNSSLMAVTKGNRLVVETKQGSWFRVFTPNGVRAWISADNVQLQRGGNGAS